MNYQPYLRGLVVEHWPQSVIFECCQPLIELVYRVQNVEYLSPQRGGADHDRVYANLTTVFAETLTIKNCEKIKQL